MKTEFSRLSVDETFKRLEAQPEGLTVAKVLERRQKYGFNEIPEKKQTPLWILFIKQFQSYLIYILLVAAGISWFFGNQKETYVILVVILLNGIVGFIQEYRAKNSIQALKKILVLNAKVYRDHSLIQIPARELVPGDILLLEEGDKIPADARLIEVKNFKAVESALTGESLPVSKSCQTINQPVDLSDQSNIVWMGTFASTGQAKAIVTAIGGDTALGQIAEDLQDINEGVSHFEKITETLAKQMAVIAVIGSGIVFSVGYFVRDFALVDIFIFAVASLVSSIPEGLPTVLTVVLAVGTYRMSKKNAIIQKLSSTETLGIVNTIVTDKTGTLTENTMTIENILLSDKSVVEVLGKGWEPKGEFYEKHEIFEPKEKPNLYKLLQISALSQNARLVQEVAQNTTKYSIIGDPTEGSFAVLGEKVGLNPETLTPTITKIDDLPFSSETKYRASLLKNLSTNSLEITVIGAAEIILNKSIRKLNSAGQSLSLSPEEKEMWIEKCEELSMKGLRVLGVAFRKVENMTEIRHDDVENLTLLGIVGMRDPIRKGVHEAVSKAKQAGIRVIMATGDHKATALSIGKEIGLVSLKDLDQPNSNLVLTQSELEALTPKEFEKAVLHVNIFARLTPQMKMRITDTLQKNGMIVAMTGDGVNDAPALKKADIGIAMGVIGTDVARESADMVLADDNFTTIIKAVEQGRMIFKNIRHASAYLITTNLAEQVTLIGAMSMGWPLVLTPIQILWLNLVTDGINGAALATEKSHNKVLMENPRSPSEGIINREFIPMTILMIVIMTTLTLSVFWWQLPFGLAKAQTAAFLTMACTQLFRVMNMRSIHNSVFELGFFRNKLLNVALVISFSLTIGLIYTPQINSIFNFQFVTPREMLIILSLSSSAFFLGELYKVLVRKFPVLGLQTTQIRK